MKYLKASKVKDGYVVDVVQTHHLHSYSDVLKLIKQKGLNIRSKTGPENNTEFENNEKNINIFAD